jgi:hypothetical protein
MMANAQGFGKSVRQQRKADEAGAGAPFEYAALPRHPPQLEERNEILAKAITATIEVLLEIHPGVARAGVRPTIELIERRLKKAPALPFPETLHNRSRADRQRNSPPCL